MTTQKQKYELLAPIFYRKKRAKVGEQVELTDEEAKRLCLQGAIALKPVKETTPKAKPKDPEPEPKPEGKTEEKVEAKPPKKES